MKKIFLIIVITGLLISCSNKKKQPIDKNVFYTCSMHPQVEQHEPGKCPICQMELIAVKKTNTAQTNEIKLSEQQIQLGNIHVDTIGSTAFGNENVLTATVVADERKVNTVSARISGRVDKLYFKNEGEFVSRGTPLIEIYSEELNNQKQQYVMLLEKGKTLGNSMIDFNQLLQSAKTKLLLWGMSESQIHQLERTRKTSSHTTVYSNASGFITALDIIEGGYLSEGAPIVKLTDLSSLWVEVQLYSSQLSGIDHHAVALVTFPDVPGKEVKGKIDFTSPEINMSTRINIVRINIPNTGNQIKPGMIAYVTLKGNERNSLTLPADAVIQDKQGTSVWIQTGNGTYKNQMVETGLNSNDRVEIKSGLKAGDVVVTSGAYLINSEYIFKKGANPMAGMDMGGMKM